MTGIRNLSCLIYLFFDIFSETLDEHNPWFCPKCGCNQCATKTLTVHRYPKFLIVYLKRYVRSCVYENALCIDR